MAVRTTMVSERRQKSWRIPATWGIVSAVLMMEVESDRPVCNCNVCGKPVSSYLSFTDDDGLEIAVGRGCLAKCEREVARMSADFIVGRYYVLEGSTADGLVRFLRGGLWGNTPVDDLMRLQSAKCVSRTRCTVTFYVPMLGQEVRVRVKRCNIECQDNEVAVIPQMRVDGGFYKGLTDYPRVAIYAYDGLGNNDRINDEMQGVYRWLNAAWSCAARGATYPSARMGRPPTCPATG